MSWTVEFQEQALKDLKRLDKMAQKQILHYLSTRIEGSENPRQFGRSLAGNKKGLWRYRIGNYRVICSLEDKSCIVLVLAWPPAEYLPIARNMSIAQAGIFR